MILLHNGRQLLVICIVLSTDIHQCCIKQQTANDSGGHTVSYLSRVIPIHRTHSEGILDELITMEPSVVNELRNVMAAAYSRYVMLYHFTCICVYVHHPSHM
jgi:hypothetical protein